ncbi:MAG: hypothetical protein MHMPM18_004887 [Marteilia pararefringens]
MLEYLLSTLPEEPPRLLPTQTMHRLYFCAHLDHFLPSHEIGNSARDRLERQ